RQDWRNRLLKIVFGEITVTTEIAVEFDNALPNWVRIEEVANKTYQRILEASLDKGEASALAYANDQADCLLIIDDLKGRKYAEQLGIRITGTLGVLIEAKLRRHITSVKPILEKINNTNFRLTPALEKKVLEKANEV
ncbi:MAG: DUF3368 domain-containing protein, partial [Bacteroidota bacterium]